ncbi:zinc finger CCCH domain-containing protein 15 homolog [Selaginella moellendorffii]|uniref:zinc finger CCCH domain-containing protein 15 homolog n=1 Tax=Selaginella moellendorffii TaxID=88036 RepID=UPI000D1C5A56|nr:zinc finger CCCH domain-containing protein 15 homolog [Selaginella moellendorffii]|eukprot:XP_024533414.1 zinc finger CCCH domain-containing protein 15 homolog [Selaginella moellendorffii]
MEGEPPWAPPPLIAIPMSTSSKRFSGFRSLSSRLKEDLGAVVDASPKIEEEHKKENSGDLEEGELPCDVGDNRDEPGTVVVLEAAAEKTIIPPEQPLGLIAKAGYHSFTAEHLDRQKSVEEMELMDRKEALLAKVEEEAHNKKRKKDDPEEQGQEKKKKKRGLSDEGKKRKKARGKIKRAEKERAMGVARRRPVYTQVERPPKPRLLCRYFMKGRCSKGKSCTFSHEEVPDTKLYLCKYFLTRCCLKGDECPFSHDTAKFPCKFFISLGFCKDGERCKFSHASVSKEEREKIIQRLEIEKKQKLESAGGGDGGDEEMVEEQAKNSSSSPDYYDPDWEDYSATPMDEDNFLSRAARQAALEHIDREDEASYDPAPGEWWKNNRYSASPPREDSFLARQAAALQENGREDERTKIISSPDPGQDNPSSSTAPAVLADDGEDDLLVKIARQAAIEQCNSMVSFAAPPRSSCSTSGSSIMDQLQQSVRESGIGIFF